MLRSISLNFDYGAAVHRDGNNAGPSLARALGDFSGGALCYWPDDDGTTSLKHLPNRAEVLDTKAGFVLFDGLRAHAVQDFTGERYSMVFFSISQYARVPLDQRLAIPDYPTEASMSYLSKLLAPPRGYRDGLRQQSILQAFGLAEREQALRWHVAALTCCPPEVLARVADFLRQSLARLSRRFAPSG